MQLLGLRGKSAITAPEAQRREEYTCPECGEPIRLRSGFLRRPHFSHRSRSTCRQSSKSATHLAIQEKICHLLPKNEAFLEHPFSDISRIADVAWPAKRLVFEVQCSALSLEEAKQRTEDYASIGYLVIWILHVRRFGKKKLSPAERYLRALPAYYTDINILGSGSIFDTFPKGYPLKVNLAHPLQINRFPKSWPPLLAKRGTTYFSGDLVHRALISPYFIDRLATPKRGPLSPKKLYMNLLDYFLRKMAD